MAHFHVPELLAESVSVAIGARAPSSYFSLLSGSSFLQGQQKIFSFQYAKTKLDRILPNSESGSVIKNLPASTGDIGDAGSIPGSERSSGGGNGNPLQYSCLENPMDRGAWWATVHRIAKSWTQLSTLNLLKYCFCFMMFWLFDLEACGILAPWPGIKPTSPVLEDRILTTGRWGSPCTF